MQCTKASYQLQLYLDHELTFEQIRKLEAHLATCQPCYAELRLLEEVASGLSNLRFIQEPANMHEQIMQRVALNAHRQQLLREQKATSFSLFRPSLMEMLAASFLATIATLAILLHQSSLSSAPNGHDVFSQLYLQVVHMLMGIDVNTMILVLWVLGTVLGVCITLAAAGSEVRTQWFKAVLDRRFVR